MRGTALAAYAKCIEFQILMLMHYCHKAKFQFFLGRSLCQCNPYQAKAQFRETCVPV